MDRKTKKNDPTLKRSSFSRASTMPLLGLIAVILLAGCTGGGGNDEDEEQNASWRDFLLAEDQIPAGLHLCEPDWPEEASPQIFVNPGPKINVDDNGDTRELHGSYQQWLTPEQEGCHTGPSGGAIFIELTYPEDHQDYETWREHYWDSPDYAEIRCNDGLNLLWWGDEAAYDVRSTPTNHLGDEDERWDPDDAQMQFEQVKATMRDKFPTWERAPCQ